MSLTIQKLNTGTRYFSNNSNYSILWVAEGLRNISVNSVSIPACSNYIIFLSPGKTVMLETEKELIRGWILIFSREFFREQYIENLNIYNIDLFDSFLKIPKIVLSPKIGDRVNDIAEMIHELSGSGIPNKDIAIASLLKTLLVYCDSRCNIRWTKATHNKEVHTVSMFKYLVSEHFMSIHSVSRYAEMMHISPKHLNHLVKKVMGVTAKSVIMEQVMIKACRDLKFSNDSVKQIAFNLGFTEPEHFSHFFTKSTGSPPSEYRQK